MSDEGWLELIYSKIGLLLISLVLITVVLRLSGVIDAYNRELEIEAEASKISRVISELGRAQMEKEVYVSFEGKLEISREYFTLTVDEMSYVMKTPLPLVVMPFKDLKAFHRYLASMYNHSGNFTNPLDQQDMDQFMKYVDEAGLELSTSPAVFWKEMKLGKALIHVNTSNGVMKYGLIVIFE
jgi:hypothetical protein